METSIRVLVTNRPRLLRELVLSTLSEQTEVSIVGEAENEKDNPSLVVETKPDFLLIALDESQRRRPMCDQLLRKFPGLGIIAVAPPSVAGLPHPAGIHHPLEEQPPKGKVSLICWTSTAACSGQWTMRK